MKGGDKVAILVVRLADEATLVMNEFFDYGGRCYALSHKRGKVPTEYMRLEDFYDSTVQCDKLEPVEVVFVLSDGGTQGTFPVVGWYHQAEVHRYLQHISLIMEGNISTDVRHAYFLPSKDRQMSPVLNFDDRDYEVIEPDDMRFEVFSIMMSTWRGNNGVQPYDFMDVHVDKADKRAYDRCIDRCMVLAGEIMEDRCTEPRQMKLLEAYGRQAALLRPKAADGFYYQAMAQYQLGLIRRGIKQIEKALLLEPEAADLVAMKGNLLSGLGRYVAAAECFERAFDLSGEEVYRIMTGRVWQMMGDVDHAYYCFRSVQDKSVLELYGIDIRDIEKQWPFVRTRGFHLKKLFGKKGG